jgi:hypothetical protein
MSIRIVGSLNRMRTPFIFRLITFSLFAATIAITRTNAMTSNNDFSFLDDLRSKYSHQPTFLQAVEEMAVSLMPLFEDADKGDFYRRAFVAMAEPERSISFRVPWMDDNGQLQFNRGFRVEFSRYISSFRIIVVNCFIVTNV